MKDIKMSDRDIEEILKLNIKQKRVDCGLQGNLHDERCTECPIKIIDCNYDSIDINMSKCAKKLKVLRDIALKKKIDRVINKELQE